MRTAQEMRIMGRSAIGACAAALAWLGMAAPAMAEPPTAAGPIAAIEHGLLPFGQTRPQTLAERMSQTHTPGVSIAFFEDGHIVWTRTYGFADVKARRPVTPATVFQAASISKPVTAIIALKLVDAGKLSLDDDVNLRLSGWKVASSPLTAERKVTLRGLLSHTAGLGTPGFDGYAAGAPLPSLEQILSGSPPAISPAVVSISRPGDAWTYSGGGYEIVQALVTEATRRPFARLAQELVLSPAGMTRSSFDPTPPSAPDIADGYEGDGSPIPGGAHRYPELAAASLWSTPSDLARLAIALQDARRGAHGLLPPATTELMMTPVMHDYGLGLEVSPKGAPASFSHFGDNEGFHAVLFALADGRRQGVAIMTNGEGGRIIVRELFAAIARAYAWPIPNAATPAAEPAP